MACNCGQQGSGSCNCNCGCSCNCGSALGWFNAGAEVSKICVTLSPAFLAPHSSCPDGCLTLAAGRYRCGAFAPESTRNKTPYCPYGRGASV